jgi:hypothetical protein
MNRDSDSDLNSLRGMLGINEQDASAPTPFAQTLAQAVTQALSSLRAAGMIEVEDPNFDALTTQVAEIALESQSVKRLPQRIVKTLIHSEFVEEVYGTDDEISAALRPFLEEI